MLFITQKSADFEGQMLEAAGTDVRTLSLHTFSIFFLFCAQFAISLVTKRVYVYVSRSHRCLLACLPVLRVYDFPFISLNYLC